MQSLTACEHIQAMCLYTEVMSDIVDVTVHFILVSREYYYGVVFTKSIFFTVLFYQQNQLKDNSNLLKPWPYHYSFGHYFYW